MLLAWGDRTMDIDYIVRLLLQKNIRWLVNETQFWSELQESFRVNIDRLIDENVREDVLREILSSHNNDPRLKTLKYLATESETTMPIERSMNLINNKIFIVHGHDDEALSKVENFVRKIGLVPIILRDQASMAHTIVEKIERHSDVGFAIVLYTPCDEMKNGKSRAQQNVVLEHGYLIGKLGRNRVCPIVKGEIETPGDISGVVYIPMDSGKAWEYAMVKELKEAQYSVDANHI